MKVTILGCGSSGGVPLIGCECPVCTSDNRKNRRSRVSVLVETEGKRILIDTSPDLREQALANGITTVDAIIFTHAHADHINGLDDVRSFNYHGNAPIPVFGDAHTLAEIQKRFDYAFKPPIPEYGWFRPCLIANEIEAGRSFDIAGVHIQPFVQRHGKSEVLGLRIGDFAYSTDTNGILEASEAYLGGLDLWIVDCLQRDPAPTHAHLAMALEWIEKFQPEKAILTHMSHDLEYEALKRELPANVEPAWDGMQISIPSYLSDK